MILGQSSEPHSGKSQRIQFDNSMFRRTNRQKKSHYFFFQKNKIIKSQFKAFHGFQAMKNRLGTFPRVKKIEEIKFFSM